MERPDWDKHTCSMPPGTRSTDTLQGRARSENPIFPSPEAGASAVTGRTNGHTSGSQNGWACRAVCRGSSKWMNAFRVRLGLAFPQSLDAHPTRRLGCPALSASPEEPLSLIVGPAAQCFPGTGISCKRRDEIIGPMVSPIVPEPSSGHTQHPLPLALPQSRVVLDGYRLVRPPPLFMQPVSAPFR